MFVHQRLSPEKLRAARLAAGFTEVIGLLRALEKRHGSSISRAAYWRWEDSSKPGLTTFDYNHFMSVCDALKVKPKAVTDPAMTVPDGAQE